MTAIEDISKDGFVLGNSSLALLSLRLSLKAYFSTYRSMKYGLHVFSPDYEKFGLDDAAIDQTHSSPYVANCSEAIVHFHHFVELVCKGLLREEHILLADFTSSHHHLILHKILNDEHLSDEDNQRLKSIQFKEALERLIILIKDKKIETDGQWDFIVKGKNWLEHLGSLRNRLVHRGMFVLRYPALDKLFGEFALPFIKNVILTDRYAGMEKFWQYGRLKCEIDPIDEIIREFKNGNDYNLGKVAFMKELARAAYEQPQWIDYKAKDIGSKNYFPFVIDDDRRHRAERIANSEVANVSEVRECPVCGISSLVIYDDIEVEGEYYYDGTFVNEKAWRYTWQALCMCCTFEVNHHLENPKDYGIPIDDFWYGEELAG
jgi:hypothetical protein